VSNKSALEEVIRFAAGKRITGEADAAERRESKQ